MIPKECKLERFFAQWEFAVDHVLCASDVDGYLLSDLLKLADEDAIDRWDRLALGYTETAGDPALRAEIAQLYDTISADEIVVCAGGAAEAIYLVINALLAPGDHAAVIWPAFEALYNVANAVGAEVTLVPLDASAGWALDLDTLHGAIRQTSRAVVINFPHNPTGTVPGSATFRGLIDLAQQHGIPVVSDEVYRFMEFDPARRLPAVADLDDRSVSVGVMSKAYGLAGLRIGWVASHDRALLRQVVRIKDYTTVCSAAPSEILALIALRARDRLVARCMEIVTDNLAHVDSFLDRWPGLFDWVRPAGGTVGFPRLNAPVPVDRFVTDLVEQEGVLLLPAATFDHPDNRFRIGLGRRSLVAAVERLDNFVGRHYADFG